jgi:hypothetical protein
MKQNNTIVRGMAAPLIAGTAALALAFIITITGCEKLLGASGVKESSDAALAGLTVSTGTLSPGFTPDTINYTVDVLNTVASITVNATAAHPKAAVSGGAGVEKALEVGANPITVTVTAEDGTVKVYTVTVTRQANTDLTGSVAATGVPQIGGTLTADTDGLGGSGAIKYVWKRGDSSGAVHTEIEGAVSKTYVLQAEDAGKYLTVTVTRQGYTGSITSPATAKVTGAATESSDAALAGLTVSTGTLSPDFTPDTISYTVTVPNTAASITVNATAAHPKAAVGGGAGVKKALEVGANPITVTVTAEDGTVKVYTVTVTRQANTDITGEGEITITRDKDLTESDLIVSGSGDSITITGPAGYDSYQWRIDGNPWPGSSATLQVNAATERMAQGKHSVSLRVVKAGKSYSATNSFTVQY